jgi:nitroimidazol reductase NimA-like FMN-containing flavoprotein (pyridoxamine 5'-phosphate oxidase superfamily)
MASMRDKIKMTTDEIKAYLADHRILILTSNGADGYPHPMPMYFWVDDDLNYYVATFRKSQKVANLLRDPKCSLLVESGKVYQDLKSVLCYARAEVVDDFDFTVEMMDTITEKDVRLGFPVILAEEMKLKSARERVIIKFVPDRFVSWDHGKLGGKY